MKFLPVTNATFLFICGLLYGSLSLSFDASDIDWLITFMMICTAFIVNAIESQ
jgi:uncharacterized membrane protein